jgi:hypothetical protein
MANHPEQYDEKTPARRAAEAVFQRHAQVYVLVNLFLVGVWVATGAGYFWPIWSIMGWGLALGLQGAATYGGKGR